MPQTLASLITSFILTFLLTPLVIGFFRKRNIMDIPGGRKIHTGDTPSMGGIAIFIGVMLALLIWMPLPGLQRFKFFYGAMGIMFVVGLRDDLVPVRPMVKLAAQLLCACMVVFLMDIRLMSLYGFFSVEEIPYGVSVVLTVFTFIVITNSFNLIDGLDGLASSIGVVAFFVFGIYFFLVGQIYFSMVCFGFIGALIAFLNFNWEPSRIFMGDTGALLIGFVLAVVTIKFIDFNHYLLDTAPFKLNSSVGVAISIIIIPLFDTLRVFISRAMKRRSPFSPDKTHLHHLLMRLGYSHSQTTLIMIATNIVIIGVALALDFLGDNLLVPIIVLICVILSISLDNIVKAAIAKKKRDVKRFRRD
ncbi:undecaprenyl/decaprenyl-phosphate alpha-N-acetylglucosaminyl 1-phosphate transferase [Marivirga sp. S37H4]|uniref:Undecaprenyl/decaprenyl-phosphate alpha-N-acetylglucosaminyl 1-phosphate transferase n=1 Tax=Marivirga aurantiaca TaxID=2802615 RepID=A0A935CDM0_9BACT|nr:MraY family glycosyltransferase [Marivirga aurantiaca]MBK6267058.1 undecaprenyl/decaprenyl-phosphate alpha-N-acetylglucosaminyl 1-phosphate transferase [Marivirga aurantiaca]